MTISTTLATSLDGFESVGCFPAKIEGDAMKLYKCDTLGVDGTIEGDCLITGVDGGKRLYCICGGELWDGIVRGDQLYWTGTGEHRPYEFMTEGQIVLDEGGDKETTWSPA